MDHKRADQQLRPAEWTASPYLIDETEPRRKNLSDAD